jgi:hypothetical protein
LLEIQNLRMIGWSLDSPNRDFIPQR